MKKLTRVLCFVLTLALALSAFVITPFAADTAETTGVDTRADLKFDGGTDVGSYSVGNNGSGTSEFVGTTTDGYLHGQMSTTGDAATNDRQGYIKLNNAGARGFGANYDINYWVVDFDISTTSTLIDNLQFMFASYADTIKAGTAFTINGKGGNGHTWYAESYPVGISHANEWAHVTIVVDTTAMIGGAATPDHSPYHVYFNGDYAFSVANAFGKNATKFSEFRIQVEENKADTTETVCIDNYSVKTYTTEYTGNLGEVIADTSYRMTDFDGYVMNDENYPAHTGKPLATVTSGETETTYWNEFDLSKHTLVAGDVITVLRDVNTPVSFVNVEADPGVTVSNENGYTFNYGFGKTFSLTANGVVSFFDYSSSKSKYDANKDYAMTFEQYENVTLGKTTSLISPASGKNSAKKVVFNLNGYEIKRTTASAHIFNFGISIGGSKYDMEFNGGTFNENFNGAYDVLRINNSNATVVFNNIDFKGCGRIFTRRGTYTLNGCNFTSSQSNQALIIYDYTGNTHIWNLTNCDFNLDAECTGVGELRVCGNENSNASTVTLNIKGVNYTASAKPFISAETSATPTTSFAPKAVVNISDTSVVAPTFLNHKSSKVTLNLEENTKINVDTFWTDEDADTGTANLMSSFYFIANVAEGVYMNKDFLTGLNGAACGTVNNVELTIPTNTYVKKNNTGKNGEYAYVVGKPDFVPEINLTLYSDFIMNIYVPTAYVTEAPTVTVDGESVAVNADVTSTKNYGYTVEVPADDAAKSRVIEFVGTDSDGIAFTASVTVDIVAYATLASAQDSASATLMNDMLVYVREAYQYFNAADTENLAKVEAVVADDGTALTPTEVGTVANTGNLGDKIDFIQMQADGSVKFVFTAKADIANLTVTYTDNVTGETVTEELGAVATGEAATLDMRAYNLTAELTINADDATGNYNLYTYITSVNVGNDVATALYNYAMSALNYKKEVA